MFIDNHRLVIIRPKSSRVYRIFSLIFPFIQQEYRFHFQTFRCMDLNIFRYNTQNQKAFCTLELANGATTFSNDLFLSSKVHSDY